MTSQVQSVKSTTENAQTGESKCLSKLSGEFEVD